VSSWLTYVGSELWEQDRQHAEQHFTVKGVKALKTDNGSTVVMVRAEVKTGSEYVVTITPLSDMEYLGSVLSPWKNCCLIRSRCDIDEGWVAEHLGDQRASMIGQPMHGGDIRALTMTVKYAMKMVNESKMKTTV